MCAWSFGNTFAEAHKVQQSQKVLSLQIHQDERWKSYIYRNCDTEKYQSGDYYTVQTTGWYLSGYNVKQLFSVTPKPYKELIRRTTPLIPSVIIEIPRTWRWSTFWYGFSYRRERVTYFGKSWPTLQNYTLKDILNLRNVYDMKTFKQFINRKKHTKT